MHTLNMLALFELKCVQGLFVQTLPLCMLTLCFALHVYGRV